MPTDDQVTSGESAHAEYLNNVDLEPEEPRRSEEEEVDCGEIETMRLSNLRNSRLLEELLAKLNPTPTTINDDGSCVYHNTDGTTVTVTETDRFGGWEALEADLQVLLGEVPKPAKAVEFTTPFKFVRLEVPPPKPSHSQSDKAETAHSWYWMYGKHDAGKKPQRKTKKRQRRRISIILHEHEELTQKEWFLFDQENGLQLAFRDHMEDERFDDETLELMEDEEAQAKNTLEGVRSFMELWNLEYKYRQEIKAGQELLAANRDNFVPGIPTLKEILAMEQEAANRGDDD